MNLLVISARGLRAGALSPYGSSWIDTPALDALAARGVVFDWHYADRADPAGARRAWRTGCYLFPGAPPPEAAPPDLLEALRRAGVTTWLIEDGRAPPSPEFAGGWDVVDRVGGEGQDTLEGVVERVRSALERLQGRDNWLLWVDLGTVLPPWDVPDEFRDPYFSAAPVEEEGVEEEEEGEEGEEDFEEEEPLEPLDAPPEEVDPHDELYLRLLSSYAAAVTYLDAGVGEILESAGEQQAVLLTADVGFALGEHGLAGLTLPVPHEELVHLPLLLRLPGGEGAGRHVEALTQAVDLALTVAGLFGAELSGAHGLDLLALARGAQQRGRAYACAAVEVGGQPGWLLRTPDLALLVQEGEEEGRELYLKPDDVWEVNDVMQHHLELTEGLERTLRAFVEATARPGPLEAPALPEEEEEQEEGTPGEEEGV